MATSKTWFQEKRV